MLNLLASSPTDLFTSPSPTAVFLSLFTLEQEYEITEIQTRIWHEILRTLGRSNSTKISLETAVKKSTSILGYPSFPINALTLYKLANLVANCSIKHYMYPIVCQLFFTIYLSRIPLAHDEERFANCYAVSDRFYEYNVGLMKRIKKQLYDADCYYTAASIGDNDERQQSLSNQCSRLFKTLQLWLEDTQLNKIRTQSIELPPQFDPHRLASVFKGNRDHWTEFIDLRSIRNEHREMANSWQKLCFRYETASVTTSSPARTLRTSQSVCDISDPKQAIFKRLEAYDAPKPPPPVSKLAPVVNSINFATESSGSLISLLKSYFSVLENYARKEFHVMYNEHQLLDSTYLEKIQKLYINDEKVYHKSIQCSSSCSRAAELVIKYKVAKLDQNVSALLADNRRAHEALVRREGTISDHVVRASVRIDAFLRQLVEAYQELKARNMQTACGDLNKVGTTLFYLFVDMTNDYNQLCPVTKDVCSLGISQLGVRF